ncbi:MAG TPA: class II fructose-bisphosphate aldolase [Methanosarcinales archaeon]|nr:class II fructose-bisphosphate aldolase [Methanosarcinales archaeon]
MECNPLPGSIIFNAVKDKNCIIMACNTRIIPGVTKGIFRAAKDLDSAIIIELAKSECDQEGGYTGLTPAELSMRTCAVAHEVGFDIWALHADHIGVKKGTVEELNSVKELIAAQIKAGFTSFAIDASHLFNFDGRTLAEELAPNIDATIELARFIESEMEGRDFGLEAEVGEIGRTDESGMVLTTPDEAVIFVRSLNSAGVHPQVLAIANGSTHGNIFDEDGNPIEQVSIDIQQTRAVAEALRKNDLDVRIAQHGITGTPRHLIAEQFPHGDIIKGNVGTFWMNLVWDVLEEKQPDLYERIWDWTITNYAVEGKKDIEIFGKNSKFAVKQFFDEIYSLDEETLSVIEDRAYEEAGEFIRAFKSDGTAEIVREYMRA